MKQATAEDVAKLAGVSRSAVSRAFTEGARISADTREVVLAAARQLSYRPNTIASSLARRRSNFVGIVINQLPNLRNPYLYNALVTALQKRGKVPVMVCVDPSDHDGDTLEQVVNCQVEAMIVMADSISARRAFEAGNGVRPIMLNENWMPEDDVHRLTVDPDPGISQMVAHLAETGHKKIAFVGGRPTSSDSGRRRSALVNAMVRHGLVLVNERHGNFIYDDGYGHAKDFLRQCSRPDAIFCANDVMAFGALDAIRETGALSVPEDIAVVGFDDIPASRWRSYRLSTIKWNSEDLVARVVEIVMSEDRCNVSEIHISTEFVARRTVRSMAGTDPQAMQCRE
ncbi:MAG: substrate-binding domain-containing protein [Rhodobacter sp.]|nr:substrate-binding domain-containing protein [Rhodobacter sp.]MCY4168804.1 substrate-binding domain-containing protein [Rhodobacter sp.]MCY4241514.1 substrate-binding domain-containing protein [Rhodobacter sp.]